MHKQDLGERVRYYTQSSGKTMEVEVFYSLGGINYFTGSTSRRGVYVCITPVELGERMRSFTLLGDNSGMKMLLEELPRKNAKRYEFWRNRIEERIEDILAYAEEFGVRPALKHIRELFEMDKEVVNA